MSLGRGTYFEQAPELAPFLLSVLSEERLQVYGLLGGHSQACGTVAATVAVITAVLSGLRCSSLAGAVSDNSLVAGFAVGSVTAVPSLSALMRTSATLS